MCPLVFKASLFICSDDSGRSNIDSIHPSTGILHLLLSLGYILQTPEDATSFFSTLLVLESCDQPRCATTVPWNLVRIRSGRFVGRLLFFGSMHEFLKTESFSFLHHKLSKRHMDFFSCWNDGTEDKGHLLQWIMYYKLVDSFTRKRIKLLQDNGMFFSQYFLGRRFSYCWGVAATWHISTRSLLQMSSPWFGVNAEKLLKWFPLFLVSEVLRSLEQHMQYVFKIWIWVFQFLSAGPSGPHVTFCLWISNMFCTHSLLVHGVEWPRDVWPFGMRVAKRKRSRPLISDFPGLFSEASPNRSGVKRKLYSNAFMFTGSWIFYCCWIQVCVLFYLSAYMMAQQTLFLPGTRLARSATNLCIDEMEPSPR